MTAHRARPSTPVSRAARPVARAMSSPMLPLAAHQSSTPANNSTGVPTTPSDAHPSLPSPSAVKGRFGEASVALGKPLGVHEGLGSLVTGIFGGWPDG